MSTRFFFSLLFFFSSFNLYAYVLSTNRYGAELKWANPNRNLRFHVNPENHCPADLMGFNSSPDENLEIIQKSLDQWDSVSSLGMEIVTTTSSDIKSGRNDVLINCDPLFFSGTGVAGVTLTTSREKTGEIVESNILINGRFNFSTDRLSYDGLAKLNYLGNVLTHEFGHAIGLDHGQTYRSSMFFELSAAQEELHSDDIAAAQVYYPKLPQTGVLSGKIVGGSDAIPIFGAYVEAVSEKTGLPVAGIPSKQDGSFEIRGLPDDDRYFLKVSRLKYKQSLPEYYASVKDDYCLGGESFKTSFFQSCRSREEGKPQAFSIQDKKVDVGKVSIQCGIETPYEYRVNKQGTVYLDLKSTYGGIGKSFVGYFSKREMLLDSYDEFEIDLTHLDVNNFLGAYFAGRFTGQHFFSPLNLKVSVYRYDGQIQEQVYPGNQDDYFLEDGLINLQKDFRIPISSDPFQNRFLVRVVPQSIDEFLESNFYDKKLIYPSLSRFEEDDFYYLALFHLMDENLNLINGPKYRHSDNAQCLDAPNSYRSAAGTQLSFEVPTDSSSRDLASESPLSCGSIALIGGNGPGGWPLLVLGPWLLLFLLKQNRTVKSLSFCS